MKDIPILKKSQYDKAIEKKLRPSACGPVTAYVMLDFLLGSQNLYDVNKLYRLLGGTKIGLFKRRFIHNMQRLLGKNWRVAECSVAEMKKQIDENRPVAAKFDKWFTWNWRGRFAFDYHWVPIVGYEENEDDLILIIHDNGGPNRPSQIRRISYVENAAILSFVKIEPRA